MSAVAKAATDCYSSVCAALAGIGDASASLEQARHLKGLLQAWHGAMGAHQPLEPAGPAGAAPLAAGIAALCRHLTAQGAPLHPTSGGSSGAAAAAAAAEWGEALSSLFACISLCRSHWEGGLRAFAPLSPSWLEEHCQLLAHAARAVSAWDALALDTFKGLHRGDSSATTMELCSPLTTLRCALYMGAALLHPHSPSPPGRQEG